MELQEKIKKLRLDKGFTQDEMAAKLAISLVTYRRLEQGTNKDFKFSLLEKVAIGLDTTIAQLTKCEKDDRAVEIKLERMRDKIKKLESLILRYKLLFVKQKREITALQQLQTEKLQGEILTTTKIANIRALHDANTKKFQEIQKQNEALNNFNKVYFPDLVALF
jgi:transcriptional regulator with XRE-family HTH domain